MSDQTPDETALNHKHSYEFRSGRCRCGVLTRWASDDMLNDLHATALALAASEARCRALEGVEQSLELAEAAQFAAELRAAGAEARCRVLQAQIEQQEAQK
jgi:hypothetical protein